MEQSPAVRRALQVLQVDRTTVQVCAALSDNGVPHLLLKGPSTARWLYPDPQQRAYVDTDLLLPPDGLVTAQAALAPLGLNAPLSQAAEQEQDGHSIVLKPREGSGLGEVDLHFSLPGVGAEAELVWRTLSPRTEALRLLQTDIPVLDAAGRALVITLHAARNGIRGPQSTEDLRRLLTLTPQPEWSEVAELARALGALPALASGLRLLPEGHGLVEQLGLTQVSSVEMELRTAQAPALAYGLQKLTETSGLPAKVKLLARELWPTRAFLEYWGRDLPQGNRRRQRASYLIKQSGPALRAWWTARRSSAARARRRAG